MQRISVLFATVIFIGVGVCPRVFAEAPDVETKGLNPTETCTTFQSALAKKQLGVLFRLMPERYQEQIQAIVRQPISAVDAEVWEKFVAVLQKAGEVTKEKRAIMLGSPEDIEKKLNWNLPGDPAERKKMEAIKKSTAQRLWKGQAQSYDFFQAMLIRLANDSALKKHAKAKAIDLGDFFDRYGKDVMTFADRMAAPQVGSKVKTFADLYSNIAVKNAQTAEPVAIVTFPENQAVQHVPLAQVENKWLPSSLAKTLAVGLPLTQQRLKLALQSKKMSKENLLKSLDRVDKLLDSIRTAKTQKEIQEALTKTPEGMYLLVFAQAPVRQTPPVDDIVPRQPDAP